MEKHSIQVNINKRVTLKRHTINYYISRINFPSHHEPLLDRPGGMYYIIWDLFIAEIEVLDMSRALC